MIGFSVPQKDRILVVSYEAMHTVHLGSDVRVETDHTSKEYDRYDPDSGLARYGSRDYAIIGLHGGRPLLASPQGESLRLDEQEGTLSVLRDRAAVYEREYKNASGDWAAATFSPDGTFIALGCPYGIDFMVLEREKAA